MPGGVVVEYPAVVKRYAVAIDRDEVTIALDGFEKGASFTESEIRRIGSLRFREPMFDHDIITRGGWLLMERPLTMLSGFLTLLASSETVIVDESGQISTQGSLSTPEDEV